MCRAADRALGGVAPGDHVCCMFGTDDEHRAIVGRHARDTLRRGERLLSLHDEADPAAICGWLAADGVDASACLAGGPRLVLEEPV